MPNRKIKHIVATLVGAQTEETLDVYDIDAVHKSDMTVSLGVNVEGTKVADAAALKTLNEKFPNYVGKTGGNANTMTGELFQAHQALTKGEIPHNAQGGAATSSRGIRFYDVNGYNSSDALTRLGGLEHIVNSDGASYTSLIAYQNAVGSTNYSALRSQISKETGLASVLFVDNGSDQSQGTSYALWHQKNAPGVGSLYVSNVHNSTFSVSNIHGYGLITDGGKMLRVTIPYNTYYSSTATVDNISINVFAYKGYPYARSGSTGSTYTRIGGEKVSVWANGATVRTNEVASVAVNNRTRSSLDVTISFTYPLCSDTNGTVVDTYLPTFTDINADFDLSVR